MARRTLPQAPTKPKPKRLATQQAAADEYDVSDRTVRNWVSRGWITGYRLPNGRGVRVDLDEIAEMMTTIPTVKLRAK